MTGAGSVEGAPLERPPGDSQEQRDAEAVMVAILADRLGVPLLPRRIALPEGGRVEVDAAAEDGSVLCEVWAHQGPPKSAQRNKVLADAFKLVFVARVLAISPRLILLFSDAAAAAPFLGGGWPAQALRSMDVELTVVELPAELVSKIRAAQIRQFR